MIAVVVRALVEALVRQIPTFADWVGRWHARRTAAQVQAVKDERNDKAIADALARGPHDHDHLEDELQPKTDTQEPKAP